MILGLDISTSISGLCVVNDEGEVVYNEVCDTRKYKNFFEKAQQVKNKIQSLKFPIKKIFIEQSLQSFRSGFSSAKTLSTLSRFNGVVSWVCFEHFEIEPEYIAAPTARKLCGIKIIRGQKSKDLVLKHVLDTEPNFVVLYTKQGNPKPGTYDRADSLVIAKAGYVICQQQIE
jgi:hypothetical protein